MVLFKDAFFGVEVQVIRPQPFEDTSYQFAVALKVFFFAFSRAWSHMYGDVIHVDCHVPFADQVMEYRVHHGLERGGGVGESEEYDRRFVQPFVSYEGCFPSVLWFDEYFVVPPFNIKAREELAVS